MGNRNRKTAVSAALGLVLALGFCLQSCKPPKPRSEETPTSGRLHILASESQAGIMRREVEEFMQLYPAATLTMDITTTRDAVVQLLNDSVRFICIDRALNAEERAVVKKADLEIDSMHVAEDALAFIVHRENPLTAVSHETLEGILSGKLTAWKQVQGASGTGSILIACTGRNSGTYELITRSFFPMKSDIPLAFLADSQRAVVDFVSRRNDAIGVVSASAVRDTAGAFRVLRIETVDSTGVKHSVKLHQANIFQGKYPYHYPVYAYYVSKRAGLPNGFATFMSSQPGQKIFLDAGLVPRRQPVRLVQLHEE
ncbi:MAG: substrate-binding domain-containing protein [Bacteroidota bacterium]|nr:substrate-binding domain-containing protein [Bacteroidota bacterium]